jgi:hypothetical protein
VHKKQHLKAFDASSLAPIFKPEDLKSLQKETIVFKDVRTESEIGRKELGDKDKYTSEDVKAIAQALRERAKKYQAGVDGGHARSRKK